MTDDAPAAAPSRAVLAARRCLDISRGRCAACLTPGELAWCTVCRWAPANYWRNQPAAATHTSDGTECPACGVVHD